MLFNTFFYDALLYYRKKRFGRVIKLDKQGSIYCMECKHNQGQMSGVSTVPTGTLKEILVAKGGDRLWTR